MTDTASSPMSTAALPRECEESEGLSIPTRPDGGGVWRARLGGEPREVAAIVAIMSFMGLSSVAGPAILTQLGNQLEIGPGSLGSLQAVESTMAMLATFPALIWSRRVSERSAAAVAIALLVGANIGSAIFPNLHTLFVLRAMAGLAFGTLTIICMSSSARAANPERVFGFLVIAQMGPGSIGVLALPWLFERFGVSAFYLLVAIGVLVVSPLASGFSANRTRVANPVDGAAPFSSRMIAGLAIAFFFNAALSSAWYFFGNLGRAAGVAARPVATVLSAAGVAGVLGSIVAAWIGRSPRRGGWITCGLFLLATSLVLFAATGTVFADRLAYVSLLASAVTLMFAWCFCVPFLLSFIDEADPTGAMMVKANLTMAAGLAFGPLMTGFTIEFAGSVHVAAYTSALFLILLIAALRIGRRPVVAEVKP